MLHLDAPAARGDAHSRLRMPNNHSCSDGGDATPQADALTPYKLCVALLLRDYLQRYKPQGGLCPVQPPPPPAHAHTQQQQAQSVPQPPSSAVGRSSSSELPLSSSATPGPSVSFGGGSGCCSLVSSFLEDIPKREITAKRRTEFGITLLRLTQVRKNVINRHVWANSPAINLLEI